jgi:hypothetical protein
MLTITPSTKKEIMTDTTIQTPAPVEGFVTADKAKKLDLNTYRDTKGTFSIDGLTVGVNIKEARVRFGHIDLLVTPIDGFGERWIESTRIASYPAL